MPQVRQSPFSSKNPNAVGNTPDAPNVNKSHNIVIKSSHNGMKGQSIHSSNGFGNSPRHTSYNRANHVNTSGNQSDLLSMRESRDGGNPLQNMVQNSPTPFQGANTGSRNKTHYSKTVD